MKQSYGLSPVRERLPVWAQEDGAAGLDADAVRCRLVHGTDGDRHSDVQRRGDMVPARLGSTGDHGEAVTEQVQGGDTPVAVPQPVVGYASVEIPGQGLFGRLPEAVWVGGAGDVVQADPAGARPGRCAGGWARPSILAARGIRLCDTRPAHRGLPC